MSSFRWYHAGRSCALYEAVGIVHLALARASVPVSARGPRASDDLTAHTQVQVAEHPEIRAVIRA